MKVSIHIADSMASTFPKGVIPMRNQIAGHTFGHKSLGMLESEEGEVGYVYKPLLPPPRGQSELTFYTSMFHTGCTGQHHDCVRAKLRPFLPAFISDVQLAVNNQMARFLKLENINTPFSKACAMDIKMGQVSYDPEASAEKREKESSKSSYQKDLGFRILGMIVPQTSKSSEVVLDKTFCKNIQKEEVRSVLNDYLSAAATAPQRRARILEQFLHRLSALLTVFTEQREYAFYASSLLFVYEGDVNRDQPLTDLRMIDFAHVFSNQKQIDENYIFGIKHLITIFQDLLCNQRKLHQNLS